MQIEYCISCQKKLDPNVHHVIAYVNGKSIKSKFCKTCIRRHWEEFAENHPECWKALTQSSQKEIL